MKITRTHDLSITQRLICLILACVIFFAMVSTNKQCVGSDRDALLTEEAHLMIWKHQRSNANTWPNKESEPWNESDEEDTTDQESKLKEASLMTTILFGYQNLLSRSNAFAPANPGLTKFISKHLYLLNHTLLC